MWLLNDKIFNSQRVIWILSYNVYEPDYNCHMNNCYIENYSNFYIYIQYNTLHMAYILCSIRAIGFII